MSINTKLVSGTLVSSWKRADQVITLLQKPLSVQVNTNNIEQVVPQWWIKGLPDASRVNLENDQRLFHAFCKSVYPIVHSSNNGPSIEFLVRGVGGVNEIAPEEARLMSAAEKNEYQILMTNPPDLCCSILPEIFTDPVIDVAGNTYERGNIEKWLKENPKNLTSPLTNEKLDNPTLTPNRDKKSTVEKWKDDSLIRGLKLANALLGKNCVNTVTQLADRLNNLKPNHPDILLLKQRIAVKIEENAAAEIQREKEACLRQEKAYLMQLYPLNFGAKLESSKATETCKISAELKMFINETSYLKERRYTYRIADFYNGKILKEFKCTDDQGEVDVVPEHKYGPGGWSVIETNYHHYKASFETNQVFLVQDTIYYITYKLEKYGKFKISVKISRPKEQNNDFFGTIVFEKSKTRDYNESIIPISREFFLLKTDAESKIFQIDSQGQFIPVPNPSIQPRRFVTPAGFELGTFDGTVIKGQNFLISVNNKITPVEDCLVESPFQGKSKIRCISGAVQEDYFASRVEIILDIQLPFLNPKRLETYSNLFKIFLKQQKFGDYIKHIELLIYYHDFSQNWDLIHSFFHEFSIQTGLQAYLSAQVSECLKINNKLQASKFLLYLGLHQTSNAAIESYKKAIDLDRANQKAQEALKYLCMIKKGAMDDIEKGLFQLASYAVPENQQKAKETSERLALAFRVQQKHLMSEMESKIAEAIANALKQSLPSISSGSLPKIDTSQPANLATSSASENMIKPGKNPSSGS